MVPRLLSIANDRCASTLGINTLLTGMFPESINHFRLRRHRTENFVDWIKAGKESYYIVSKFEHFEYTKVAPLFASLSSHFEQCVYGLNQVKNEPEENAAPDCSAKERTSDVRNFLLPP